MTATVRVRAVDFLRVAAALQMVEGHTIDALLDPSYRHGAVYQFWIALRGLTSVAFLLAAGLSFQLATLRDLDRHLARRGAVAARFARAGTLVLLGYLLRLPLPWPADGERVVAVVEHALATDVLQCIGVSLALLEALVLVLRRGLLVEVASGVLAIAVLGLSASASRLDPHGPWLPLLTYLSPRAGSQFPLLPWSAHVFFGVALARHVLSNQHRGRRLALAALSLRALAYTAKLAGLGLAADHLGRLSFVLFGLLLLELSQRALRSEWPLVMRISGETLFIYAFHALLVYGRGFGLADAVGGRLSPIAALLAAIAMIGLSFGCAMVYRRVWGGLAQGAATG